MMKIQSMALVVALGLGSRAGTAHAQQNAVLQTVQWSYYGNNGHEQREYDSGYRDGQHSGMEDARHGRGFDLYGQGAYRHHRDSEYRDGFERGYREAYQSNARTYQGWRQRDDGRDRSHDWTHNHY